MKEDTAVALRYQKALPAPFVLARGRGELARKLVNIAAEHEIPLVRQSELAESLYGVEVGAFIPEPFFRAVAEILAVVLSVRGDGRSGESHQGQ